MRPTNMRCPRTVRLTAGALAIAAPTSAVALAAVQPDAPSSLHVKPASSQLEYGQALTVTGRAPRADGGLRLALEFAAAHAPWRAIAHTKVHSDGAFRLRARLTRSGTLRVATASGAAPDVATAPGAPAAPAAASQAATSPAAASQAAASPTATSLTAASPAATSPAAASPAAASPAVTSPAVTSPAATSPAVTATRAAGAGVISASPPERVAVAAKLITSTGAIDSLSGQRLDLGGQLLPRRRGRIVRLQRRAHGSWRTLAVARTRASGHFALHYVDQASGGQTVRVSFAGDSGNAAVHTRGRKLIDLQPALASWYDDAANTACGFHAADGIAN